MSNLYLVLALIGTFGAIIAAGVVAQTSMAERRRTLDILQANVKEVPNMRTQELAQPMLDRIFVPMVEGLGRFAKCVAPVGMRDRIARQLVLAGSPEALNPDKVAAAKLFGAIGGGILGLAIGIVAGWPSLITLGAAAMGGAIFYLIPGAGLGQRAIHRQEEIRRALPDTMDLLTISVEAGLGFDAALAHVRRNVPGPLSDEIGRFLQEIQLGISRQEALRNLANRTDIDELKGFVLAMIQADQFGISVGKVLRSQSKELRIRRRQRAEEMAIKVPVKLLFPLILGILPAIFIVIAGPGVIKLVHSFLGNSGI
jgi:tight adherence protein C